MRRIPLLAILLLGAIALLAGSQTAFASPSNAAKFKLVADVTPQSEPAFTAYERTYLSRYKQVVKRFGQRQPGRNIVDDGMLGKQDKVVEPSAEQVRESSATMYRWLHPPEVTTTSTAATSDYSSEYVEPEPTATTGALPECTWVQESGGSYTAVNPSSGAGGKYQFLPSTWQDLGYSGAPQDAPPEVQEQAAAELYAQSGTEPWVNC